MFFIAGITGHVGGAAARPLIALQKANRYVRCSAYRRRQEPLQIREWKSSKAT